MISPDTIVAISSAVGPAARMIVRTSGPGAHELARRLIPDLNSIPGSAQRSSMCLRGMVVPIWAYAFVGPRSYTGEDLVELHIPGSPLLARLVLDELVKLGARQAEAGEFTARAYFNGRLDLTEAEGVAATIGAQSEGELRAARQLLAGELARRLRPMMDLLADTLALVEVGIDFSDEDVTFIDSRAIAERVRQVDNALADLIASSSRFERLSHEPQIVLVGRPNAGKSTLLNALAGHERAVVSPIAGTTRDALSADVRLRRGIVKLIDVAGIDASVHPSDRSIDHIEHQMQDRAMRTVESADVAVAVSEIAERAELFELPRTPDLVVLTKLDLHPDGVRNDATHIAVSAVTGQNMDRLREMLDQLAFGRTSNEPSLALNSRHLAAIDEARAALARAADHAEIAGPEIVALDLRESLDALGRILGQITPDDVLGRVFAKFCIGK